MDIYVGMHIVENKSKQGKKIYHSVLLRESYRVGDKVRKRTVANLSSCKPEEIAAIKLALSHKDNLSELGSLEESVDLRKVVRWELPGPSIRLPKGSGLNGLSATSLPENWPSGRSLPGCSTRVPVFQPCASPRSMPSATCWP